MRNRTKAGQILDMQTGSSLFRAAAMTLGLISFANPALADKTSHPTAVFAGLDKITGRIIAFEVAIDETVQFGALQITPRICYTRPQTEAPQTTGFIEVDEIGEGKEFKRIFSGWMFAASPGLHGVEHPVYDVWVTDCKGGTAIIADPVATTSATEPPANADVPGRGKGAPKPKDSRRKIDPLAPGQDLPPLQGSQQPSFAPPANIPQAAPEPRRAPTQRFFPTDRPAQAPYDPAGR